MMLPEIVVIFYGRCAEALSYYQRVFSNTQIEIISFKDVKDEFGAILKEEHYNLIYKGRLIFKDGSKQTAIIMQDSPSVLFQDPKEWTYRNTGNLIFNYECMDDREVRRLYHELLDGGISNGDLSEKSDCTLYGSVIDHYNLCWNIYHLK